LPLIHVAPTWEYQHVERPVAELSRFADSELNALGAQGWELVGLVPEGAAIHILLKRLAPEP
jgi:hypothetical protein